VQLPLEPSLSRPDVAERLLSLNGPSIAADPGRLPLRGDLAHIKLAGRCFVPHYAAPMLHRAKAGAVLLVQARDDAEMITALPEGSLFEVLDIAGSWAWGQIENDGFVGYVPLADLEALA
jgi:hypothetical protein